MKLTEKQTETLLTGMITCQVNLHYLEEMKRQGFNTKMVGNRINLLIKELIKKEKAFDALAEQAGDSAIVLHDAFFDFCKVISKLKIYQYGEIKEVIEKYLSDETRRNETI